MTHESEDSSLRPQKRRNFDDFLSTVGSNGRYQKIMAFCVILPAVIPSGFLSMSSVFLAATPHSYWCSDDVTRANTSEDEASGYTWVSRLNSSEEMSCYTYLVDANFSVVGNQSINSQAACSAGIDFDHSVFKETIVTEWDLVCDDKDMATWTFTIFTFGGILGPLIWGWIADRFGRKTGFFACVLFQSIFAVATAFSPNYAWFCVFRFLTGMTSSAGYTLPFVLLLEITGPESRAFFSVTLSLMYSTGAISYVGIAYFVRDWRDLALIGSLVAASIYVLVWWFFPESPRWLLSRGKYKKLEVGLIGNEICRSHACRLRESLSRFNNSFIKNQNRIFAKPLAYTECTDSEEWYNIIFKVFLLRVARINGRTLPADFVTTLPMMLRKIDKEDHTKVHTVFDLFKTPNMRKKTIILVFINICNKGISLGLNYYAPAFSPEPYWKAFLNCVVEWPCYLFAKTAFDRLGRRSSLFVGLMTGSLACLSTYAVPHSLGPVNVVLLLTLVAKFCITFTYVGGKLFEDEMFPTVVRGEGHSVVSVLSSSISCGVPFVVGLGISYRILPLLIFGSFTFVGAVLVFFLPETVHQRLPQTLEDGEKFGKNMTWREMFRFLPVKTRLPLPDDTITPVPSQPYELDILNPVSLPNGASKTTSVA